MKKISLLLLVIAFSYLVFAEETITVDTVRPEISATFNETVSLINATLTSSKGDTFSLTNRTDDNKTFFFNPQQSLYNGFYAFIVKAIDRIGNEKEFRQNIIVNVEQTQIFFVDPQTGVGTAPEFMLKLGTTKEASCRWSVFDIAYALMNSDSFDDTGELVHTIDSVSAPNIEDTQAEELFPIFVACQEAETLLIVEKTLFIGYDPSGVAFVSPIEVQSPVVIYPPSSTITARTNDRSVCFIDGTTFSGQDRSNQNAYSFISQHTLTWPPTTQSNGQYKYTVQCFNLAGTSATQQISVNVSLSEKMQILVNFPRDYIKTPLSYSITTTKPAVQCNAKLDNKPKISLSTTDDRLFTRALTGTDATPAEGSHAVVFDCIGEDGVIMLTKQFLIDNTAPGTPSVTASACAKTTIDLVFSATDNASAVNSGIAGFNYTVLQGMQTMVPWRFTTSGTASETGLNLSLGTTYSVKAIAFDRAGNPSTTAGSQDFKFDPNITIACQEKNSPVITINIAVTPFGRKVALNCADESGCTLVKYGVAANTANCTPTTSGTETTIQSPQAVCWLAEDKWMNRATGSQFIPFQEFAASCSNSVKDGTETAIDCGGSCQRCQAGISCNVNTDCASNFCNAAKQCEATSCTDQIQNGFETAIDCGGLACGRCALNKTCIANSDCVSNFCNSQGLCEATSCTDKIQNGFETDVDCGGSECDSCDIGSSCSENSDCLSSSCQFGSCVRGELSFEEWAEQNDINPEDREGDADGDGLTNEEEFIHKTNPNSRDTDGDGYSDLREVKAGTDPLDELDFPVSLFFRTSLFIIGFLVFVIGMLFMYYFRVDPKASLNMLLIGGAALLFVLIDWLIFTIPKPILLILSLISLGGAGYLGYKQKLVVMQKLSGKPSKLAQVAKAEGEAREFVMPEKETEKPLTKEELAATKQMIEMIKKQKEERERKREAVFAKFGKETRTEEPKEKVTVIEPIKKGKILKKETKAAEKKPESKEFAKLEQIAQKEGATSLSQLSKLLEKGKVKETSIEQLERLKKKEDAFARLSDIAKSKADEVFRKLPSSAKGIEELEKLEKRKKKK
jgi:hypothetical protein